MVFERTCGGMFGTCLDGIWKISRSMSDGFCKIFGGTFGRFSADIWRYGCDVFGRYLEVCLGGMLGEAFGRYLEVRLGGFRKVFERYLGCCWIYAESQGNTRKH